MEVRIQAIHFDASERLQAFINKKAERLARHNPEISVVEVTLSVVKPESAKNKEVRVKVTAPGQGDIVATKVCDTFEEAVDINMDAVEKMLERRKDTK